MAGNAANISLLARMRLQAEQWKKGVGEARQSLDGFSKSIENNAVVARAAGAALSAMAVVGAVQIRQAVRTYSEFGQAIQNVRAVAGATEEEFRQLSDAAIRIGATTRLNANQAADALYNLASAGLDAQESIAALDGVSNLALATLSDMGTASQLVTATLTQFQLEAGEASRVADVFANAIGDSPANMRRLTDAMRQAGPTAAALGISLEETVAAVEGLFQAGLEGGQAGASIRFFLSTLLNPSGEAKEVLEDLGLTLDEVNPQIVGIRGALAAFEEANLSAADAIRIFSTRGATAYLSLASQGSENIAELEEGLREQGTAARVAAEQMDTFQGSIDQFTSAVESARIIAGSFIGAVLRPFIDFGTRLVSVFNTLPRPVQAVATGLGVIATVLSAVVGGLLLAVPRLSNLRLIFTSIGNTVARLPALLTATITGLRAQSAAFLAASRSALAYAASVARAALAQLRPRNLIASLGRIAVATRAAYAQMNLLRISAFNLGAVLPGLARGIRVVIAAASAHPVIAALTAAIAGISLLVVGVRNNVGGLGDAFTELREAFRPLGEAFAGLGAILRDVFTASVKQGLEVVKEFAPFLTGPLVVAARLLASVLTFLAGTIENVGNAFLFLRELFSLGPIQALERYAERTEATFQRQVQLQRQIWRTGQDAADAMGDAADAADDAAEATGTWQEQLANVKQNFEGDALIAELETLLERFKDNEEAVIAIGEELGRTEEALTKLREEGNRLAEEWTERFEGLRISMIEDDQAREIANVRREFEGLREELRAAMQENTVFAGQAGLLLAESYALEAEQIRRIREEARQERLDDARSEAEALEDAIAEREQAVTDLVIEGTENRIRRVRLEFEQRYTDAVRTYNQLEARAEGNADALARIQAARNAELSRIDEAYVDETLGIYDAAFSKLEDRQDDFTRAALERAGDGRGLLRFDYNRDLSRAEAFYDDLIEQAEGNAILQAQIEQQRAEELTSIRERYVEDSLALQDRLYDTIEERETSVAIDTAERAERQREVERLEYEKRLEEAEAFYADLREQADGDTAALRRIAALRAAELTNLLGNYQDAIAELDDADTVAYVEATIGRLTEGLEGASVATLRSVREQVEAWAEGYAGREGVAEVVTAALEQIDEKIAETTEATADRIETLLSNADRFVANFDAEATAGALSELERGWLSAAESVSEAQALIRDLQEELITADLEQRAAIGASIEDLQGVIEDTQRRAVDAAKTIVREATDAYREEVRQAQEEASEAAVDLVLGDVEAAVNRIVALNEEAALSARSNLNALIDRLAEEGLNDAALAPLREQAEALDELLGNIARNTAEFAATEYRQIRQVASAILDEAEARDVRLSTLAREVELSRAALDEARNRVTSLDDLRDATRNLTDAQLAYIGALEGEISTLTSQQSALTGILPTLTALGEALDLGVSGDALINQRALVESLFDSVLAAQEAGASFGEYQSDLDAATRALEEYRTEALRFTEAAFDRTADAVRETGSLFSDEASRLTEDLEGILTNVFDVPAREARLFVIEALREARDAVEGEDFDFIEYFQRRMAPFEGTYELDIAAPDSAAEVFERLGDAATDIPETFDALDQAITDLETDLATVRDSIEDAINFDAAVEGIVSGYQDVVDAIGEDVATDFTALGRDSAEAYRDGFRTAVEELQEDLADEIGTAASSAGETAGAGLIAAFVQGIRDNSETLEQEIEDLLQGIRDYLPSSDAKRGPLSTLTASGRAFVSTFAAGAMSQGRALESNVGKMMGGLIPQPTAAAARMPGAVGTTMQPIQVNVDGRSEAATGPMALSVRQLVRAVQRELSLRGTT